MVAMPTRGFPWVRSILYAQQLASELGGGLAIQVGQPVSVIRNRIARTFLESDCTHLLTIDDDVVPPLGALARLLAVDRPVATAVYPLYQFGRFTASVKGLHDKEWPETWPPSVFPVTQCGLGCALIHHEVFERVKFPWFHWPEDEDGVNMGEDVWFCRQVRQAGLQIFCDGTVVCGHVKSNFDLAEVWREREAPDREAC
jgi:hypothetical protein